MTQPNANAKRQEDAEAKRRAAEAEAEAARATRVSAEAEEAKAKLLAAAAEDDKATRAAAEAEEAKAARVAAEAEEAKAVHLATAETGRSRLSMVVAPAVLFLLAIGLLAVAAYALGQGLGKDVPAQIQLPLLLILGVVVLLMTLGALVALMQQWGLTDPQEAMALPKGTIRAVIALGLILIFAISSVFLVVSADATTVKLPGVTAERLQTIPLDRIVAITPEASGTTSEVALSVPTGFRDQISQQLLTVMATLVTAVVAFYFGTASARVAAETSAMTAQAIKEAQAGAATSKEKSRTSRRTIRAAGSARGPRTRRRARPPARSDCRTGRVRSSGVPPGRCRPPRSPRLHSRAHRGLRPGHGSRVRDGTSRAG